MLRGEYSDTREKITQSGDQFIIICIIKMLLFQLSYYSDYSDQITQNYAIRNLQTSVSKPKGKRPLGRHWRIWEDPIKTDLN